MKERGEGRDLIGFGGLDPVRVNPRFGPIRGFVNKFDIARRILFHSR